MPIKHNEIFVLTFSENLRRISDIILAIENLEKLRKFWQTIESNFTDKTLKDEKIFIVEGGKVITRKNVVEKFKDHFRKIVETLKIDRLILSNISDDLVLNAIENFPTMRVFSKSRKQGTLLIVFPLS